MIICFFSLNILVFIFKIIYNIFIDYERNYFLLQRIKNNFSVQPMSYCLILYLRYVFFFNSR